MNPKAVVTRRPPGITLDALEEIADVWLWEEDRPIERSELADQIRDATGLYSMLTDTVDADLLELAPSLIVISNMAVGVDNIDLGACAQRGIAVGHTPDVLTDSTADIAWMLIMASSRRMQEGIEFVRSGNWGDWHPEGLLGRDIARSTLGIIGMGRIGEAIAARSTGFGMDVLYSSRSRNERVELETGAVRVELAELLARSDHVVVAVPLAPETVHMIGAEELDRMKESANLVNIARGAVVDSDALFEALSKGVIRCAGLDVTDPEPLPSDHRLLTLPNCTVIPHMGSATWETRTAMADLAMANLIAGLTGQAMPHRVPGT
ncbi:MAG: D-glycerate dehydrogenase [Actinomycetota bacterium]|nr:D-glycerate dehydrogenase [Actinomycetota bacterium]